MSRFWNKKTQELTPYVAGEQPREGQKVIKLNTNENPYPPSPSIRSTMDCFDPVSLRLYPDPQSLDLRMAMSDYFNVPVGNIFCGNGSDEVLAFAFQAFFESGAEARPLLLPDISYSFYPVYAKLYDIPCKNIPLREDMRIDVAAFCDKECGGVVIANPNAPTGISMPLGEVESILKANPNRVVLIDEAYVVFGGESAIALIDRYPNLLVVGTLSKSHALAGLRLGYAIASEELIEGLCRIRDSFNSYPLDRFAQKIAEIAVRDRLWTEESTRKILATRERMQVAFLKMGLDVLPSSANFLFVNVGENRAEYIYNYLKNEGILVRYFKKLRISGYLRISVGTDNEVNALLTAMSAAINSIEEGEK